MGNACGTGQSKKKKVEKHLANLKVSSVSYFRQDSNFIEDESGAIPIDKESFGIGEYFCDRSRKSVFSASQVTTDNNKITNWEPYLVNAKKQKSPKAALRINPTEEREAMQVFYKMNKAEFLRLLIAGPHVSQRWNAWKTAVKMEKYFKPELFQSLLRADAPTEVLEQIDKDFHRTFPSEKYFTEKINEVHVGHRSFRRVAKALAMYFPKSGYVQGMNFVLGFVLLASGSNEEESFWFLVSLFRRRRYGFCSLYEDRFPLLNLFNSYISQYVDSKEQKIKVFLTSNDIPPEIWLHKIVLGMFTSVLPFRYVVRVWDFLLGTNGLAIVKVTLALFIKLKGKMLKKGVDICDFQEMIKYLQGLDSNAPNNYNIKLDPESLIKKASIINLESSGIIKKGWESFTSAFKESIKDLDNHIVLISYEKWLEKRKTSKDERLKKYEYLFENSWIFKEEEEEIEF